MSFSYSKVSRKRRDSCHPDLIRLADWMLENSIFDISIVCGHRGEEEQNEAYRTGKSGARWGQSKHNQIPSDGMDIAAFVEGKIDWFDKAKFIYLGGLALLGAKILGIDIRWPIVFRDKNGVLIVDYPHIERVVE